MLQGVVSCFVGFTALHSWVGVETSHSRQRLGDYSFLPTYRHWTQWQCHLVHITSVVTLVVRWLTQLEGDLLWFSLLPKRSPFRGGTNQSAGSSAWTGKASVLIYVVPFYMKRLGDLLGEKGLSSPVEITCTGSLSNYLTNTCFLQNLGSPLCSDHTHQIRRHNRLKNAQFTNRVRTHYIGLGYWHYYDWSMYRHIQSQIFKHPGNSEAKI